MRYWNATLSLKILDSKDKTKSMKALISVLLLVSLLAFLGEAAQVVFPSEIVGWWHLQNSKGKYSVSKAKVTRQPKLSERATVHGTVSKDFPLCLVF